MKWLDRRIAAPGPYLCLCLSEADYLKAMAHCKIKNPKPWLSLGFHGKTHRLANDKGERVCIVTVGDQTGRDPIEVAGLLVHEAVHVWQDYCESLNENEPAVEQEAYAIQIIAQELMNSYRSQMK
jgi:hypothetical protein